MVQLKYGSFFIFLNEGKDFLLVIVNDLSIIFTSFLLEPKFFRAILKFITSHVADICNCLLTEENLLLSHILRASKSLVICLYGFIICILK